MGRPTLGDGRRRGLVRNADEEVALGMAGSWVLLSVVAVIASGVVLLALDLYEQRGG
jgi:hypothetical protein